MVGLRSLLEDLQGAQKLPTVDGLEVCQRVLADLSATASTVTGESLSRSDEASLLKLGQHTLRWISSCEGGSSLQTTLLHVAFAGLLVLRGHHPHCDSSTLNAEKLWANLASRLVDVEEWGWARACCCEVLQRVGVLRGMAVPGAPSRKRGSKSHGGAASSSVDLHKHHIRVDDALVLTQQFHGETPPPGGWAGDDLNLANVVSNTLRHLLVAVVRDLEHAPTQRDSLVVLLSCAGDWIHFRAELQQNAGDEQAGFAISREYEVLFRSVYQLLGALISAPESETRAQGSWTLSDACHVVVAALDLYAQSPTCKPSVALDTLWKSCTAMCSNSGGSLVPLEEALVLYVQGICHSKVLRQPLVSSDTPATSTALLRCWDHVRTIMSELEGGGLPHFKEGLQLQEFLLKEVVTPQALRLEESELALPWQIMEHQAKVDELWRSRREKQTVGPLCEALCFLVHGLQSMAMTLLEAGEKETEQDVTSMVGTLPMVFRWVIQSLGGSVAKSLQRLQPHQQEDLPSWLDLLDNTLLAGTHLLAASQQAGSSTWPPTAVQSCEKFGPWQRFFLDSLSLRMDILMGRCSTGRATWSSVTAECLQRVQALLNPPEEKSLVASVLLPKPSDRCQLASMIYNWAGRLYNESQFMEASSLYQRALEVFGTVQNRLSNEERETLFPFVKCQQALAACHQKNQNFKGSLDSLILSLRASLLQRPLVHIPISQLESAVQLQMHILDKGEGLDRDPLCSLLAEGMDSKALATEQLESLITVALQEAKLWRSVASTRQDAGPLEGLCEECVSVASTWLKKGQEWPHLEVTLRALEASLCTSAMDRLHMLQEARLRGEGWMVDHGSSTIKQILMETEGVPESTLRELAAVLKVLESLSSVHLSTALCLLHLDSSTLLSMFEGTPLRDGFRRKAAKLSSNPERTSEADYMDEDLEPGELDFSFASEEETEGGTIVDQSQDTSMDRLIVEFSASVLDEEVASDVPSSSGTSSRGGRSGRGQKSTARKSVARNSKKGSRKDRDLDPSLPCDLGSGLWWEVPGAPADEVDRWAGNSAGTPPLDSLA